ncbi:hypothetical protein MSG28_006284 [Choristoneura fumiferana]|uniref:Uncharacterized protein n=2 Tax=Choristoneura fumiferana TaxID=7141 RepID=A0ACC0JEF1_CHOFU|nr:hypothetical protein MSG28_006284 [Choristoneura fumiferana]KAI8422447.1 hypothetical protein MSG28_006284 [Choristoneura fumiferana]
MFKLVSLLSFVAVVALVLGPAAAKPQVLVDYGYSGYYASPAYVASYSAPLAYSYPYAYSYTYPYAYL